MELQAKKISARAAKIIEQSKGFTLKAKFQQAVNLESAAGIITVQTDQSAVTPLTIQVGRGTFADLFRFWCQQKEFFLHVGPAEVIDCRMLAATLPTAMWVNGLESLMAVLAKTDSLSFSATERLWRQMPRPTTVQASAKDILLEAEAYVQAQNWKAAARSLDRLSGLGPGLTPAGDDFLLGVLAACSCWQEACTNGLLTCLQQEMIATLEQRTWLSKELLRCALDGEFAPSIQRILHAKAGTALAKAAAAGVSWGHTSGSDTLGGILWMTQSILISTQQGGFAL